MDTQVTLTLPDYVYRQAEAAARRAHRPVSDLLAEVVVEAFPRFSVDPRRERMEQEEQAYMRQQDAILAEYEGMYVAVHGGEVVDHDTDETELVRRIQARYPDEVVHLRLATRKPEVELWIRSPRFID